MKKIFSLASVVKTVAAIAVLGLSFTGCQRDDLSDHSNKEEGKAKLTVTDEPKPTPKDSLWENSWVAVDTTVINLWWKYLRNDTVIQKDSTKTNFGATISVDKEKVETNATRLANLVITEGQITPSRDGKNNYQFRQTMTDNDGQTYPGLFKSGYAALKDLKDVHAKLIGFKSTGFRNIPQPTPADMDTLVITRVGWKAIFEVENGKNLAGQQFEIALDSTDHFRYIPKGAPQIVDRKPFQYKELGIWKSTWTFGYRYYWDNGTVTGDSMQVVLNGSYETIELKDKVVGNLADYSHADGTLKFKERTAAYSADSRVKKFDNRYEKESYATNGIENDKFRTLFAITVQDATAEFCDTTWTFKADEVAMTTTRNVFVDEDSDMDGYSMVRFTDTESAKYADGKGDNTVALKESCKLYLKVATPADLEKIEFNGTKIHANNKVSIDGSVIPVYSDGTKGGAIEFSWERAEEWYWKKDSVIAEGVTFVNQTTGELKLKGDVKESKKTFATDNDEVTIECTQFDADFELPVTVDGVKKMTTWHATWFENFYVVYQGKKVSLTKSSYNVKNQNDKLSKDEAKSSATSEVWGYSVEGIFSIDEDSRSAYGYGRITKALEEVVIKEYWSTEKSAWTEYGIISYYKMKIIREYNTGKTTEQEFTYKHIGTKSGSSFELTAQSTEHVVGAPQENVSLKRDQSEKISDMVSFNYDLMKLDYKCQVNFDGAPEKTDIFHFEVLSGVSFSFVDINGETQVISFDDFNRSFTNNVKSLTVKSENESETQYNYVNEGAFTYGGTTANVNCLGLIHVAKASPVNPDFDIEVGSIFASVSRPSNRNASDITAYTYLLVSKDGTKCLPLGIYHDVVTVGEITDMQAGFNSACYVKDVNKVVATRAYSDSGLGMMIWCGADGNPVDAASHLVLQGAGFNNRGNDWINHTGKYAPRATKKGNVTVVTFEGTNVSYTFLGWNVQ